MNCWMDSAKKRDARTRVSLRRLTPAILVVVMSFSPRTHAQTTTGVQANPTFPQAAPVESGRLTEEPPSAFRTTGGLTGDESVKTPINRGSSRTARAGQGDAARNPIWTTLGLLCLLLAGLFGILQLMRRFGPRRLSTAQPQVIQLVDRQRLDSQTTIYLLRIGRRVILAGQSAGGLSSLAEIDDPQEVADLFGSESATAADRKSLGALFSNARAIRRESAPAEDVPAPSADTPVAAQSRVNQEAWHA